ETAVKVESERALRKLRIDDRHQVRRRAHRQEIPVAERAVEPTDHLQQYERVDPEIEEREPRHQGEKRRQVRLGQCLHEAVKRDAREDQGEDSYRQGEW